VAVSPGSKLRRYLLSDVGNSLIAGSSLGLSSLQTKELFQYGELGLDRNRMHVQIEHGDGRLEAPLQSLSARLTNHNAMHMRTRKCHHNYPRVR
jgi:hypothetical protein